MNLENLCIISNFEGWGLTLVAYKDTSLLQDLYIHNQSICICICMWMYMYMYIYTYSKWIFHLSSEGNCSFFGTYVKYMETLETLTQCMFLHLYKQLLFLKELLAFWNPRQTALMEKVLRLLFISSFLSQKWACLNLPWSSLSVGYRQCPIGRLPIANLILETRGKISSSSQQ